MIGDKVTFDGHLINDIFRVGEVEVSPPSFEPSLSDRPKGARYRGRRYGTSTITIPLVVKHGRGTDPQRALALLLSWLDVDGVRDLSLSRDSGRVRRVVPLGVEVLDHAFGDVLSVSFEQVEPYLIGDPTTVTMSVANDYVTFTVGGTAKTGIAIACTGVRSTASDGLLWQITDEAGNDMAVEVTTSSQSLAIDTDERTVTLGGVPTTITLASDWLRLSPGEHTLRLSAGDNYYSPKITWRERWHA